MVAAVDGIGGGSDDGAAPAGDAVDAADSACLIYGE